MTEIKLDRRAVAKLVEDDPSFKLNLQASVVSELVRKLFEKDAAAILNKLTPDLFNKLAAPLIEDGVIERSIQVLIDRRVAEKGIYGTGYANATPSKDVKAVMAQAIEDAVSQVKIRAKASVLESVNEIVAELLSPDNIDERIRKRVDTLEREYLDRRVTQLFNEKLNALSGA